MTPETLTLRHLNRATLARQMLLARAAIGVVDVVERLAGMQAQEAKWPFIGLWACVEGFQNIAILSLTPCELLSSEARSALTLEGEGLLRFVEPNASQFMVIWKEFGAAPSSIAELPEISACRH